MAGVESESVRVVARFLAQRYAEALYDGDFVRAESALREGLAQGLGGPAICSRLIAPAMRQMGELWERNDISVADEHLATGITHHLLGKLQGDLFPPPREAVDATAVVGCLHGEEHTLGSSMLAYTLRSMGWRVLDVGAGVPPTSFAGMLARYKPNLVGLSATMAPSAAALNLALESVTKIRPDAQVILGGNGIPPQLREPELWAGELEEAVDLLPHAPQPPHE